MVDRYQPHPDAAYRAIDDHVFIITPDSRQHELDGAVELLVWRLCESEPRSKDQLLAAVLDSFEIDEQQAGDDLNFFISEMLDAGVIAAT